MALPMLRGCYRLPSTLGFTRLFLNERPILNWSGRRGFFPCSAAAVAVPVRPYSSGQGKDMPSPLAVGILAPIRWFRRKVYYFLIRTYFDKDFSIEEFTEGATQAFSRVSKLLSKCQFKAMEGLVAKDLIGKLEEKCNLLPSRYMKALSPDPEDIMYTDPVDVGIFYDDNGRKFVSIVMRFWYMTTVQFPDDFMENAKVYKLNYGDEDSDPVEIQLITACYEFQREFTKGVPPDWVITRIEHTKMVEHGGS